MIIKYKSSAALFFTVMISLISSLCQGQGTKDSSIPERDTLFRYIDGSYEGKSRAGYTDEPYWGIVRLKINKGIIADIKFMIRDSALHELFNENYEKHFEGNPLYIQQCRNDWKGVQTYPLKLTETQQPDTIDVISGATWSSNIFKASVKEALRTAKR